MTSQTSEITVFPNIPYMGDTSKMTNFVDVPGLMDTEGCDQEILDKMVVEIKKKCPRIDMFVLCFEAGKFDAGIQIMMQTYENLLDKRQSMWDNMMCIITKASWNDDHVQLQDWIDEMERWKNELGQLLRAKYKGAEPTIFAISQDITRPRREENKPGTE